MFRHICSIIALFVAVPLWSQESVNATASTSPDAAASTSPDEYRMMTPPPVSGVAYPAETAAESRSNYVEGGLTFNTTYTDNLLGGGSSKPISDIAYSVWPTIAFDQATPRLHTLLTYSPGFTIYQHTSADNQANQNVGIDFRYRLSQHVTLSLQDSLHKLSNVFNQPDLLAATPVSGSAQSPAITVVAPLADQLSNTGNVELTYQFSRDSMAGASGTFMYLHYLDSSQAQGLNDASSRGGSAFYSHRLAQKHYVGASCQYDQILSYPSVVQSQTQTQTVFLFYTVYLKPRLSLSFSGGPEHWNIAEPLPSLTGWSPAATASFGWQARHTALSGSYSRMVASGGGLGGAYHTNNAAGSIRQQLTRNWNVGGVIGYSIYKTLDPSQLLFSNGGHTIAGSASVERKFGEHFQADLGYTRLHQSYNDIPAVSVFPNVNREWVSISYQFAKALGR
jgi:hypothetical protein